MANFSEIIRIETLRKQLLKQIEILDDQISSLNQDIKSKGSEINQSQIENTFDIGKHQQELKSNQIELALLQKWLELLNSGIDPADIDLEQLRLDVNENAKIEREKFEDQFLDLKEVFGFNEGISAIANRLGKQYFSPNLHPETFKDRASNDAQYRLNTIMSEPELAESVFTDIFSKALQQLLQSNELNGYQVIIITKLIEKYTKFNNFDQMIESDIQDLLQELKSDDELKLIFRKSPELKTLLNITLKEIILNTELPEGKSVAKLREIIIRKKSEIATLEKILKLGNEINSDEGQAEILDINEQYYREIQVLKVQIKNLNLQIREKIQSLNVSKQQAANEALENARASLEKTFENSDENVNLDIGSIIVQKTKDARSEIAINNFENKQKEYKEKLMKLPGILFKVSANNKKLGSLELSFNEDNNLYSSKKLELIIEVNCFRVKTKKMANGYEFGISLLNANDSIDLVINEPEKVKFLGAYKNRSISDYGYDCYYEGNQSLKNAYIRIKEILKRDFEIDIDNLENSSSITESKVNPIQGFSETVWRDSEIVQSTSNAIESQETLARAKYKQIQDICSKLEQKANAGIFGQKEKPNFFIGNSLGFNFKTCDIYIPEVFDSKFSTIHVNSNRIEAKINPKLDYNSLNISLRYKPNGSSNLDFSSYNSFREPR